MTTALVFPGQGSQRAGMGAPGLADPGWSLVERAGVLLDRDIERLLLDADDEELRGTSEAQLTAPVRWRQVLEMLPAYGVDTVVEVGHGGVLAGLVRRTLPGVRVVSVATPEDVERFG